MNKRFFNQQNLTRRLKLLSVLFAVLLLPLSVWAEDSSYFGINTSSGSYWVTDGNATDVLEDGSYRITYDVTNNILTLNGIDLAFTSDVSYDAFIAMADTDNPSLTVRLVGNNKLTLGDKACVFYGSSITFTTDTSNPGSLTINTGENWSGSLFTDNSTSEPIDATYNNGLSLIENENSYIIGKSYGLTIGGVQVTNANASNVLGNDFKSVSYDPNSSTLTLKGANFVDVISVDEGTEELKIHLVGYNWIGNSDMVFEKPESTRLTFTTSTTLPGSLVLNGPLPTDNNIFYENGLSYSDDAGAIEKNLNNTTVTPFTGYVGYVDNEGSNAFIYSGNPDFFASYARAPYERTVLVSPKEGNTYLSMWPASFSDNSLINKIMVQFDWGTCTNKNVTVQVRGMEYDEQIYDYVYDGNTYSDAISLSTANADGIIEIPITNEITSENFELYFSSDEGFSFYPLNFAFTKIESYGLTVAGVPVTSSNKGNVFGDTDRTVQYDDETQTLTLDNANFTGNIQWTSSDDLIVNLVGSNEITIADANDYVFVGNAATAAPKLTLTTDESAPGTLKVNGLTSKNSIASGWSSSSSKFVYASDDYPADGDWWVQAYETDDYMDIILNRKYDLWISGSQYCDANLDPVAGAKFVPETSTLEYGYYGTYSFISSLPALTVKVTADAQMGTITFQSKGDVTSGTLTFEAKDADGGYSLSLSSDDGGPAISGFSSVNLTNPMHLISPETTADLATASWVKIANYDSYNLSVGDIDVTSLNKDNVLNDENATVKYNDETNTLTLNGATINGRIFCGREEALTVHLLGNNVIDGQYDEQTGGDCVFSAESCEALVFTTDDDAPGKLVMKNTAPNVGGYPKYFDGFEYEEYENGLTAADNDTDKKLLIATAPVITPAEGIYRPTQQYTITGLSGATLKYYYRDTVSDPFVETAASSFTMETIGRHLVQASQTLTVDGTSFEVLDNGNVYIVRNALTFNLPAGTYGGTQNVKIENLPAGYDNEYDDAQVWYYLGENKNDSVQYTSADQTIEVSESTKVTAYIIDGDSGKQFKSAKTEAEYTIKANPNLRFTYIWQRLEMGNTFSQDVLSDMETAPTVTWSSSNTAVATVDPNTGVVTPVAPSSSEIQITATFAGDDTYAPATASYDVRVVQGKDYLYVKDGDFFLSKVRVTKGQTLDIKENYNLICPAELVSSLTWTPDDASVVTVENGVISADGCGNTRIVVASAGNSNYESDTYEFYVDAAPPAPEIAPGAGTYLSTDGPIKITKVEVDGTAISYTWDDITNNDIAPEWKDYDPEAGVALQTGTLYARVGYTPEDYGDVIYSDTVSVIYTVILDPELKYMQGTVEVTTAEWTLGKADNTLPVLQNTHSVAVTYASDNTDVAMVATDGTVTVVGIGTATITATAAATDGTAADEASYTLTVNRQLNVSFSANNSWATYYGTEDLTTPEGLQAYAVTGVGASDVTTSAIDYIPANTAVLLKIKEGEMVPFSTVAGVYTGASSTFSNMLIGSAEAVSVSSITTGTVYILINNMFRRASGTIPANRGYLVVTTSGNAPQLSIIIGDETTSIDNGQWTIDNYADEWYTLDGQKLQQVPTRKGLYIKNGKKVVIK